MRVSWVMAQARLLKSREGNISGTSKKKSKPEAKFEKRN